MFDHPEALVGSLPSRLQPPRLSFPGWKVADAGTHKTPYHLVWDVFDHCKVHSVVHSFLSNHHFSMERRPTHFSFTKVAVGTLVPSGKATRHEINMHGLHHHLHPCSIEAVLQFCRQHWHDLGDLGEAAIFATEDAFEMVLKKRPPSERESIEIPRFLIGLSRTANGSRQIMPYEGSSEYRYKDFTEVIFLSP